MLKELKTASILFLLMTIITGLAYPAIVTGFAKTFFSNKISGSLVEQDSKIIGSELIGQQFAKPEYFHPRPSLAGNGYDAMSSGASNQSPTSEKLSLDITERQKLLAEENPGKPVPADLLTASGSGLDPHISVEAANFQIPRIAKARNIDEAKLTKLVEERTEGRALGLFGEPRINVLLLNVDLDKQK